MGADGPGTGESASTSGRASSSSSSESTAEVAKASGTPETGLAAVSAGESPAGVPLSIVYAE